MKDPNKFKELKTVKRSDILFSMARFPNSSKLIVGSSDSNLYSVDPMLEKPEAKLWGKGHSSYVTALALAGDILISGSFDRHLIWWDSKTGKQIRKVKAHQKWIRRIHLSPDSKTLASVADDMVCRIWDVTSGRLLKELQGHAAKTPHDFPSMLFTVTHSPCGKFMATADKVGHVVVWDTSTWEQVASVETPLMYTWDPRQRIHSIGGVRSLAFSGDSKKLAIGGIGQIGNIDHLGAAARVEIFDWEKGEQTHEFPGDDKHKGLVEFLRFDKDNKWLFAAGGDHGGFVQFFDLDSKKVIRQDKAPMHVHDVQITESEELVFGAGHQRIAVWKLG